MHQVSGQDRTRNRSTTQAGAGTGNKGPATNIPTSVEGLWVLLVANEGELPVSDAEGRVPMMARAGDEQTYLLAFKNVVKARAFLAACEMSADPRMVVRGNRAEVERIAAAAKCAGVLVDYDPTTQGYLAAIAL